MSVTKSLDGSDGLIVTPDHSITVFKSGHQQNKPKLQGGVEEPVQITATSAVQPTNQDGEIEFVMRCFGPQKCRLVGMVSNSGNQLRWRHCAGTAENKEQVWKALPSPKINVVNQLSVKF